ncbi:cytochrome c oxidase subunit 3 [Roseovarius azorensis]|uniref:Cytochrome c oxidase subunit 3 n=1 Tax=Roseovarius azorensis TaxID=1287727 RepID=A0A1H7V1G8_9RHOB|nr:cytochrome c oxidase subunit 3 [Roseovarius azorensis]SEM02758.1 cytochrome c oxidase subunit 3 [Roseovarius azorensis]
MDTAKGAGMTVILVFILSIIALSFWWLLRQGVMSKPWLETGAIADVAPKAPFPVERVGLGIFLVVVGSLFALFGSAFVMRMDLETWSSLTLPGAVWLNTSLLLLASVFFHLGKRSALRGDLSGARRDMTGAGLATLGFLIGQLLVWRMLQTGGDGLTSGPAASFFYLLSGLHGLHILGGIVALGAVLAQNGIDPRRIRLRVGLCAAYWDFLLIVWLGLLILFMGWANRLIDICRTILT